MKKSTSITFEESTIKTVSEMCKKNSLSPSFSKMAENLIKTNPEFIKHENGKSKKHSVKK